MASASALDIHVRQVTKAYGAVVVLDRVDLHVQAGEFLTLLGPSGSGKTTLLMMLAGFTRPDSGSILFGTQEVIRLAPQKRDVGMVFQNYALFPHMNVAANIAFPLRLRKTGAAEIARRVEAALDMVQLAGYGARGIDELSGGQRQRVALARALVFEPRIILMDEPLSALDKQLRELMQLELRRLHEKLGTTTIYVTHDQREALTMSDRIAVINKGRIAQLDTPRHIYSKPNSRFVAEFIGESTFLNVAVTGGVCRYRDTVIKAGGAPVRDGRCLLMIRPEQVRIVDGAARDGMNCFDGRIVGRVFQGDTMRIEVDLGGGDAITLRVPANSVGLQSLPDGSDSITLGLTVADTTLLPDER
ncbi:MAG: ABC transporter ATP-binding protein [Proteobacteria bacterium]|nr:ABC transporter ATP-binding protein [Pseudomonadota bacterium]